jgi:hypothetical protein
MVVMAWHSAWFLISADQYITDQSEQLFVATCIGRHRFSAMAPKLGDRITAPLKLTLCTPAPMM